jgi:hypothetical protein
VFLVGGLWAPTPALSDRRGAHREWAPTPALSDRRGAHRERTRLGRKTSPGHADLLPPRTADDLRQGYCPRGVPSAARSLLGPSRRRSQGPLQRPLGDPPQRVRRGQLEPADVAVPGEQLGVRHRPLGGLRLPTGESRTFSLLSFRSQFRGRRLRPPCGRKIAPPSRW